MRWRDLCGLLDACSFAGAYDFVYMPANFKKMASFGFGFVNFINHEEAVRALHFFQGFVYRWTTHTSKSLEVDWSDPHQGITSHLERFRNCPVMHPSVPVEFKPVWLVNGVLVEFPSPTETLMAPREFRDKPVKKRRGGSKK
jgi:RNA recognition motif-containing protein